MAETFHGAVEAHRVRELGLRAILRSASCLALVVVGTKVFGFVEKLLQARNLGTTSDLDAYLVAISIPLSIFVFAREVIEPVVLPIYLQLGGKSGNVEARCFAARVGLAVVIVGSLAVAIVVWQPDAMIGFLAPGLEGTSRALAARLCRYAAPGGLLLALSSLTGILLNAHRRFLLPASADLAMKAILAAGFGLAVRRWGIASMAPVFLVACAARLAVHLMVLPRDLPFTRPWGEGRSSAGVALRLAAPLVLAMIFSQFGSLADNHFASRLGPGVISALSFGRKLVDLPLLMTSYSISVVAFPYFADLHLSKDDSGSSRLLYDLMRLTAVIFAWMTAWILPMSRDIVSIVYERGAFRGHSVDLTTPIFTIYAATLIPLAVESILVQYFFSRRDLLRPVSAGIGAVLLHVGFMAATWRWLGPASIVLALGLSKTFKVCVLLRWAPPAEDRKRHELRFLGRLLVLTIAAGMLCLILQRCLPPGTVPAVVRLAIVAAAATIPFLLGKVWSSNARVPRAPNPPR